MQIEVTGRNVDITEALRHHITGKVEHDLHDFPETEFVHVVLELQRHRQMAEVVVQAGHHVRVEADAESDDMYASIDLAVERAAKQMRKHRDRVQEHHHESLAEVEREIQDAETS